MSLLRGPRGVQTNSTAYPGRSRVILGDRGGHAPCYGSSSDRTERSGQDVNHDRESSLSRARYRGHGGASSAYSGVTASIGRRARMSTERGSGIATAPGG